MQIETYIYRSDLGWNRPLRNELDSENTLIILFADSYKKAVEAPLSHLLDTFGRSKIVGCSTAGEIFEDELHMGTVVAAVMKLECSTLKVASCGVDEASDIFSVGENLMMNLKNHGSLKGVFVLSDGLNVNGSELTRGINSILSKYENVVATGALAGDNDNFESTWVIADGSMRENVVTAVGFYGENIYLGSGSQGGWDRFGIDHKVTRSEGNVLYTLDEKPALDLYKRYLGEYAKDLPSSGLLFPLQVKVAGEKPKVRTILSIDEKRRSITFAGDIEEGSSASFMKANFDNLISGAEQAAMQIDQNGYGLEDALLIAVSCVGRRLVLGQRSEDELEVVRDIFPLQVKMVGFYSYGEISTQDSGRCDLLNQTMTLTWLRERCR